MVLQKDRGVGLGVSGQVCETYLHKYIRIYEIYIEILRTCSDMASLKLRCKTKWNPNTVIE